MDPELELCNLTAAISSGQALPEAFDAGHPIVGKTVHRTVL